MPEETTDPLTSGRAALAETDARFAETDRLLLEALRSAHRVALESVQRLAAIHVEIGAAVARRSTSTSAAGPDFARFLLAKNREIAATVAAAQAESEAKAVLLQSLASEYRITEVP